MRAVLSCRFGGEFVQPFLCISIVSQGEDQSWFIDIDGKIHQYISPKNKCRKALVELCKMLASNGFMVNYYGSYAGSAGPSHILRCGAIFSRMNEEFESKSSEERGEVNNFSMPKYEKWW